MGALIPALLVFGITGSAALAAPVAYEANEEPGWRTIEIMLSGASEWLHIARVNVCELPARRQRYLALSDQYRKMERAVHQFLDPMLVISTYDSRDIPECDKFESALGQANQMLEKSRAELKRMEKLHLRQKA